MSDYQAIYDATVYAFSGFCPSDIVREYVRAAQEAQRPSALFRPKISIDGDKWCALYGDNLQDGVAGFGCSPSAAMEAFDNAWFAQLSKEPT